MDFRPLRQPDPAGLVRGAVFVYYYIQIDLPVAEVASRVRSFLSSFDAWAESAYRDGEDLTASISLGSGPSGVAKTVRMRVRDPVVEEAQTTIPIIWEATGPTALFPKMEGSLIVAPLGPDMTQLAFRGSYEPPLGAIGRALDKVLMNRVAESSVKGFVDRIGVALAD